MNVTIGQIMVDADDQPEIGPYVRRDHDRIYIGYTFEPQEERWTPVQEIYRRRAYLPDVHNIEAAISFTVDEARIILRGLQDLIGNQ